MGESLMTNKYVSERKRLEGCIQSLKWWIRVGCCDVGAIQKDVGKSLQRYAYVLAGTNKGDMQDLIDILEVKANRSKYLGENGL